MDISSLDLKRGSDDTVHFVSGGKGIDGSSLAPH